MNNTHDFRFFDALDYSIFGFMLLLSALIGVYFAFFAKEKQNTTTEYLMGGRKMGIFPISMSLIASYISGIALIGLPSEMYVYGTQLWILVIGESFTVFCNMFVYIPVFYKLQIMSSYEYLGYRFNKTVQKLGSALFLLKMMLYIPIVVYVPALAFAQVTGFSLHILIPTISVVCVFYTTLGGIKAVVWTDTIQMILMVVGVLVVSVLGTLEVGGFDEIVKRNNEGDRIEFFNMNLDPSIRHTFINITIGKFFQHLASCTVNQAMVQRCLAMPTLTKARIVIFIFAFGIVSLVSICCYNGLVIYAAFHDCDPVASKVIKKYDQLLPYFVMKITSHIPALPGVFVSAVFSAALSSMSTGLNSMTGVILQDFIRPSCKKPLSEATASFLMKVIVVILGIIIIVLAFVVDQMGGLVQTSGSLAGITAGTLLGIFTLGMLFPWANSIGALAGGIASTLLVGWMCVGAQFAVRNNQIFYPQKPVSVEGCVNLTEPINYNFINRTSLIVDPVNAPLPLYTISYTYYTLIGTVTVIVVGLIVSFLTGANNPQHMDPDLFSPVIHKYLHTDHDVMTKTKLVANINEILKSPEKDNLLKNGNRPSKVVK